MISPPDLGISLPDPTASLPEADISPPDIAPATSVIEKRSNSRLSIVRDASVVFLVALLLGGTLWGIGANLNILFGLGSFGLLAVSISLIWAGWLSRWLRWWLVPYIVLLYAAMIPVSTIAQITTGPYVARLSAHVFYRFGDCAGWQELGADLAPIAASTRVLMGDIDNTKYPGAQDMQRWADMAAAISQQYKRLDHPPALDDYARLAAQTMLNYQVGYHALALGAAANGQSQLRAAGKLQLQAQEAFQRAAHQCTM